MVFLFTKQMIESISNQNGRSAPAAHNIENIQINKEKQADHSVGNMKLI